MIIDFHNVYKNFKMQFRKQTISVLKGVSFNIQKNEIFGYLGPNGAGKTTTIKILMGLIKPDNGKILIFNDSIKNESIRKKIGFLPENPSFYPFLSAYETLKMIGELYGMKKNLDNRIKTLLSLVGLEHAIYKKVATFSKGMIQRLAMAQTIINDPELIILDEPLSGLDPIGRKEMKDLILMMKKQGKTIFFSSHILPDIEMIADRVSIINKGKIIGSGYIRDIIKEHYNEIDIEAIVNNNEFLNEFKNKSKFFAIRNNRVYITVEDKDLANKIRELIIKNNGTIVSFNPREIRLEDYFMNLLKEDKNE